MIQTQAEQFEALAKEHLQDAYRLSLRLCGNAADAEDITQEAFQRAVSAWESFEQRSSFQTWMFSIVVNVFRTHARRRARLPDSLPEQPIHDPSMPNPEHEMEHRELQYHVGQLVSKLPDRQREVLVLSVYHECSHAEIARVLEITEQSVRTNLHVARRKMKELLQPFMAEG